MADLEKPNLRIPGPTPCRDEVLAAVGRPMMNYRGPEMAALVASLLSRLKRLLETEREFVLLSASGTGGLEACVQNLVGPGERVIGVDAGVFGKRFCLVAEACGASVRRIDVEWGRALEPDALREVLRDEPRCRAVLLTHNETSTAIAHPIEELCRIVRNESDALLAVDAVSSLGAMPLAMDELGIDVVVTGSQKAWGVPPGMSFLGLSERAWAAGERASGKSFYFDLSRYREAIGRGTFPFTPALPVIYGLDVALDLMLQETAQHIYARHERVAEHARSRIRSMGLELFGDPAHASATVTAIRVPDGIDEAALVAALRDEHRTTFARGQERLRGAIIRLGHLGWVHEPEIDDALDALAKTLAR